MHTTRALLLGFLLLLAGCASSGSSAEPAPKPARLSDPAAEAARLKAAEAAGDLEPNALKHAAYLGDAPARSALGLPAEFDLKELGKIPGLGGPSAFRTALAGQVYAAPETNWASVQAALSRWISEPGESSRRDETAAAVAKLREDLEAELQRKSGAVVAGEETEVVEVPEFGEAEAREILRLSSRIEALRFLEQCAAQAARPERLSNALDRALRPAMDQAYADVERDDPGPRPSKAVQEDLARALAAHNRGPESEEARAYVQAHNAHQRSLRPKAKERLLQVLRESLVPELLGR